MLRNRDQRFRQEYPGDFAPMQPPIYTPPNNANQLDPKDERLLELSQEVGKLYGVNDLLQEDNVRLENENAEYKRNNAKLEGRNRELESQASADSAGHRAVSEIIDKLESEISKRKITKESK